LKGIRAAKVATLGLACLGQPKVVQADSGIDTEHIFGFTEGSGIGDKGEKELENSTIGSLGRPGNFAVFNGETDYRYNMADRFRASFGDSPMTTTFTGWPVLRIAAGHLLADCRARFDGNFWNARQAQSV